MPWTKCMPMDARLQFAADLNGDLWSLSELSERYGISRKTAHKWAARFWAEGPAGLQERSRRPLTSPRATAPAIVGALIDLRRRHPRWSAKKLLPLLAAAEPEWSLPAVSTAQAILKQHGLVRARRRRPGRRVSDHRRTPAHNPNDVWTADYKGEFRTRDSVYCYPLTVMDAASRYALVCDAHLHPTTERSRASFWRLFRSLGLPQVIRTDNGSPFASCGLAGLSRLAVEWILLGIHPERIAPGRPDQNGSHERFHRTLKDETTCPPAANRGAQQQRFRQFCHTYNTLRPHEFLKQTPPATHYSPSPRPCPRTLPQPEYPGHYVCRRVMSNGCLRWHSQSVFVSSTLVGQVLGLEPHPAGLWTVHLGDYYLGVFDPQQLRIEDAVMKAKV